jgi:hypothetical protein
MSWLFDKWVDRRGVDVSGGAAVLGTGVRGSQRRRLRLRVKRGRDAHQAADSFDGEPKATACPLELFIARASACGLVDAGTRGSQRRRLRLRVKRRGAEGDRVAAGVVYSSHQSLGLV